MSERTWTPAPWEVRTIDESLGTVDGFDGFCVAQAQEVSVADRNSGHHERRANARLIAAAPDLYEALEAMVERIEYYATLKEEGIPNIEDWAYTYRSGDMQKARAALSRATEGEAK